MIEILTGGTLNSVQDLGRAGHMAQGVCQGGAMDAPALKYANLLVGNDEGAAGIEVAIFPFRLRFHRDAWFACTGASVPVELSGTPADCWSVHFARAGDTLHLGLPHSGTRAMVAISGGIDVPQVLGARASDLKSAFGGLNGRALMRSDRLPLGPFEARRPSALGLAPPSRIRFAQELANSTIGLRVLPGPEYSAFSETARRSFCSHDFFLSPACNRMGYRLTGPALHLDTPLELLSHAVVPGIVQVPPDGQAIVQMAEANTHGGYPRIATVLEADLWRLAQMRPGQKVRFHLVDQKAALAAFRGLAQEQALVARTITRLSRLHETKETTDV